jgi:hypothetical protein
VLGGTGEAIRVMDGTTALRGALVLALWCFSVLTLQYLSAAVFYYLSALVLNLVLCMVVDRRSKPSDSWVGPQAGGILLVRFVALAT